MANILCYDEEFIYTWKVQNLQYSSLPKGKCITSPKFTLLSFRNTTWHLKLYPNGCKTSSKGYISCYLHREYLEKDEEEQESIEINYELSARSFSNKLSHSFPAVGQSWGCRHFLLQSECYNTEVIKCTMRMPLQCSDVFSRKIEDIYRLPFHSDEDLRLLKLFNEVLRPLDIATQNAKLEIFSIPRKCFARTEILIEKRNVIWPINRSLIYGTESKQVIPVYSSKRSCETVIILQRNDQYIQINFHLLNVEVIEKVLLICKLRVLDSDFESTSTIEEKHIFKAGTENRGVQLKKSFETSELKRRIDLSCLKKLNFSFELEFAFGEIYSNIEWENNFDTCPRVLEYSTDSGVSAQIQRLYNENKFCDTVLQVKDKIFNVHKTVLCAMSPVFSAMFMSDMIESNTNTINIDDFNEDSVSQMISFLYSGTVEIKEFDKTANLFAIADKYQIFPLMNLCRDFMIDKMTIENLYELLLISNTYADTKLKKSVMKYIHIHKNSVLVAKQWKTFETQYPLLALDILRELYLEFSKDDLV